DRVEQQWRHGHRPTLRSTEPDELGVLPESAARPVERVGRVLDRVRGVSQHVPIGVAGDQHDRGRPEGPERDGPGGGHEPPVTAWDRRRAGAGGTGGSSRLVPGCVDWVAVGAPNGSGELDPSDDGDPSDPVDGDVDDVGSGWACALSRSGGSANETETAPVATTAAAAIHRVPLETWRRPQSRTRR